MGFFKWIGERDNKRAVRKIEHIADKVIALEDEYKALTDAELRECTAKFKARLEQYETLDDILPDAYACVREASARVLNMRHFYVQIIGGIALHQGRIAEMRTGEGKTLVATLPAYLNALTGKGVHIVTVNDYLARRDSEWMGKVFRFLGLSVAVSVSGMKPDEKRRAYNADITYCTNNELGFDYLRDNMVNRKQDMVQRPLNYAIVDEVDSILIDEARTPLIISGRGDKSGEMYLTANKFAKYLRPDDYEIDEKKKTINLTEEGITKAERYFNVDDLASVDNVELNHYINNAIRAHFIMKRDNDYIVRDGEVIIVDEFTGRLMIGRRYSEGLHQAIEAKENVRIQNENKTMATITFQNYFRLYPKLAGMTGTAKTEEGEFNDIYNLDVVVIPPNREVRRVDEDDQVYTTRAGKLRAIVADVKECYEHGQPVLVGTVTVEKSEELSQMLSRERIPHNVLNAKNHEREADIVAQAGKKGAVTIATNMAGRGTDILLGGNAEYLAKRYMREHGWSDELVANSTSFAATTDEELLKAKEEYKRLYAEFNKQVAADKETVIAVGGLRVIGTERHESRRIDNQLRGRSGRQGDCGSSIFYLSMEDDLVRLFGGDRMKNISEFFKVEEDTPLALKMLTRQIENAQRNIEGRNYSIRKQVLEYDNVMNTQREVIYSERNKVLMGDDVHAEIVDMFDSAVENLVGDYVDPQLDWEDWNIDAFNLAIERYLLPGETTFLTEERLNRWDIDDIKENLRAAMDKFYNEKMELAKSLGADWSEIERIVLLRVVDMKWMDHIDAMDVLKRGIGLRAYGQQDPVIAYKKEGYDMFDDMIMRIREQTVQLLMRVNIQVPPTAQRQPDRQMQESRGLTANERVVNKPAQAVSDKEVGRNDPCPCGSGKKYKNCCGR